MRKVYVIIGSYKLQDEKITKVICVCSSINKATKNVEIAKNFYDYVEIQTEVLI